MKKIIFPLKQEKNLLKNVRQKNTKVITQFKPKRYM